MILSVILQQFSVTLSHPSCVVVFEIFTTLPAADLLFTFEKRSEIHSSLRV